MAAPRYVNLVSGVLTQIAAVETGPASGPAEQIVSTNASGMIDVTLMPTGVGPDVMVINCTENLAAGDFVNIYNNSGAFACRRADGSTTGKTANGFVLSAFTSGTNATVYLGGINTQVTAAAAFAGEIYLSDATPGGFTSTPPSTAGHTVQRIGTCGATNKIQFQPYAPVTLS